MEVREVRLLPLVIGLVAFSALAADITGTWKGQVTDPYGNTHDVVFTFKVDSNKLTGTVVGPPPGTPYPILNGKIAGDSLWFAIAIAAQAGTADTQTFSFAAKVTGNQIKGSVTSSEGDIYSFTVTKLTPGSAPPAPEAAVPATTELQPPNPRGGEPRPQDAQTAILAAFDKYDIVAGLGVTNKDTDDLLLALIRNPAFPDKVNDIAVECGNSLYQPILDRYIAGEDVPLAEVRQVWRNTTQPNCGFSAFYEELFPLVRRINEKLPPARKLRVLACDPPIDWSKVKSPEDLRPFMGRDQSIAAVIEREVLAKHRHALMPFGINHVRHGTSAARMFETMYPNVTFVIADYHGFGESTPLAKYNDELEKRMASWPVPSVVTMKGTWLADLECAYFDPDLTGSSCRGYPGVDAYLYVGPRDVLLVEPIPAGIALDKDYMTELQRRAAIRGRPDGPSSPAATLQRESQSSVLLHDAPVKKPVR